MGEFSFRNMEWGEEFVDLWLVIYGKDKATFDLGMPFSHKCELLVNKLPRRKQRGIRTVLTDSPNITYGIPALGFVHIG